jgi:ribosomal protein L7/L12
VEVPSGIVTSVADTGAAQPETFNVFLSQITGEEKRAEAVKLISEIRKCPIDEARELVTRSMIPLLKDVPKSEAEVVLHRFRSIKVAGRMTLARKG